MDEWKLVCSDEEIKIQRGQQVTQNQDLNTNYHDPAHIYEYNL